MQEYRHYVSLLKRIFSVDIGICCPELWNWAKGTDLKGDRKTVTMSAIFSYNRKNAKNEKTQKMKKRKK